MSSINICFTTRKRISGFIKKGHDHNLAVYHHTQEPRELRHPHHLLHDRPAQHLSPWLLVCHYPSFSDSIFLRIVFELLLTLLTALTTSAVTEVLIDLVLPSFWPGCHTHAYALDTFRQSVAFCPCQSACPSWSWLRNRSLLNLTLQHAAIGLEFLKTRVSRAVVVR